MSSKELTGIFATLIQHSPSTTSTPIPKTSTQDKHFDILETMMVDQMGKSADFPNMLLANFSEQNPYAQKPQHAMQPETIDDGFGLDM